MKIYTKRGDEGQTDLFGGERVFKNHPQVRAYGDIDCANTAIGMALGCSGLSKWFQEELKKIMKLLFCAGAEVATAKKQSAKELLDKKLKNQISGKHIDYIEHSIDEIESKLSPLKSFILPSGTQAASNLHFARNQVRKVELSLLDLQQAQVALRPEIMQFFNRLSDYLFVLARYANFEAGVPDITWHGGLDA